MSQWIEENGQSIRSCDLCGQMAWLPIPSDHHIFCCHGCKELYHFLGAEQVEILKQQPGLNWDRVQGDIERTTGSVLQALDPRHVELRIEGITCPSCAILIEQVLLRKTGVMAAKIDFTQSIAEISLDASLISQEQVQTHIGKLGYRANPIAQMHGDVLAGALLMRRFLVACILTAIMMMVSVPIWSGDLPLFPVSVRYVLMDTLLVLATVVLFYSGWPFLRGAFASIKSRVPTMDLLVSIGSVCAYGYSVVSLLTTQEFLYFDTVGLLITFLLLSRNLEYATRERAQSVLHVVKRLIPKEMRVLQDGYESVKNVCDVQCKEQFVLSSGEVSPVDGKIVKGEVAVDESVLTGEAKRVEKGVRDLIYAGTRVFGHRVILEVIRTTDTLLEQTAQYVRLAQASHSHWNRLADRLVRVFVPFVLTVALSTWIYLELIAHMAPSQALLRAIAVLVIGCPCALSIATPLAILGASQRLSTNGVLLRSPDALERAGRIEKVVFDKTGTITTGRLHVEDYLAVENVALLQWVASAEVPSEHPIADALVRKARELDIPLKQVTSFVSHTSMGIEAVIDGHVLRVGACVEKDTVPVQWRERIEKWQNAGFTIIYVLMDEVLCGVISLSDELRQDIHAVIAELRKAGMSVSIASGDSERATSQMAHAIGITEYAGRQTALEKSQLVHLLKEDGKHVAFIGDGVNDSPALVAADLGIAMGSSADIALEAGHLVLAHNNIAAIPITFYIARMTTAVIRQNLIGDRLQYHRSNACGDRYRFSCNGGSCHAIIQCLCAWKLAASDRLLTIALYQTSSHNHIICYKSMVSCTLSVLKNRCIQVDKERKRC